jgi:hypothetical protein
LFTEHCFHSAESACHEPPPFGKAKAKKKPRQSGAFPSSA